MAINADAGNSDLQSRVLRDQRDAETAAHEAQSELGRFRGGPAPANTLHELTEHDRSRIDLNDRRRASLQAIADEPFQAMAEVYVEVFGSDEIGTQPVTRTPTPALPPTRSSKGRIAL